jgi:hypothetical protein
MRLYNNHRRILNDESIITSFFVMLIALSADYSIPASYLNPCQSIYYYDITNRDSSIRLTNVSKRSDIEITYDQLNSMREK